MSPPPTDHSHSDRGVTFGPLRPQDSRDYPLITGTVIVYTLAFVTINFTIDILYALIDPRIRFDT